MSHEGSVRSSVSGDARRSSLKKTESRVVIRCEWKAVPFSGSPVCAWFGGQW